MKTQFKIIDLADIAFKLKKSPPVCTQKCMCAYKPDYGICYKYEPWHVISNNVAF